MLVALADARLRFPIPADSLRALVAGGLQDLDQTRYASFAELHGYCTKVAGAVGVCCIAVYGSDDVKRAETLGVALQLINIMRDVAEDLSLGRVYLPQDELHRFGVHELGTTEGDAFQLFLPALVGTIVAAIPAGFLADRLGKKPVLAVGLLAFSLIALAGSQARDVPQALVAMGFIGLANGVWTALNIPLLVDLVPPERAAEMTGLGSGVWSLAQPIGAVIAGVLIGGFDSYRASFIGAAALVFVSFLLLLSVRAPRVAPTP